MCSNMDIFETPRIFCDCNLRWQAFHARCPEETNDATCTFQHIRCILWFRYWSTVTQHDDVGIDRFGGVVHGLDTLYRLVECECGMRSDAPFGGQSHMRYQDICACTCQGACLLRRKGIWSGEQVQIVRYANHLDLQRKTHSRLFQILPELPIIETNRRKILYTCKAHFLELLEELRHQSKWISAAYTGQHRCMFHNRQHLARHLYDDSIGVSIRHQSCQGAPPSHAVATGVVNNDKVNATRFSAFGRKPRARTRANNHTTLSNCCT